MTPLDLARTRDLHALLSDGFALWRRHFVIFFALALLVVAPVRLIIDGLWTGTLTDWDATGSLPAVVTSSLADVLLIPALVTAAHVIVVLDLAEGRSPSVRNSLAAVARLAVPVATVVALYFVITTAASLLLIVPGVWLGVKCYFGAQAVIVDDERGVNALRRSSDLVEGQWWRAFGVLTAIGLIALLLGGTISLLVGGPIALITDTGALVATINIVGDAVIQSFTALVATLFVFDLRVRTPRPTRRAAVTV